MRPVLILIFVVLFLAGCRNGNKNQEENSVAADTNLIDQSDVGDDDSVDTDIVIETSVFDDRPAADIACIRRLVETGGVASLESLFFNDILTAFEAVEDNDSIFIRNGRHDIEKAMELWEKNNIVLTGEGKCKIVCDNINDNVLWIITCENVQVSNLHLTHTNPAQGESCVGNVIGLDMGRGITIENCSINGCGAIGVYIWGTEDIKLKNNHIFHNSLWAVQEDGNGMQEAYESEKIHFEGNRFEDNGYMPGSQYDDGIEEYYEEGD